MQEPEARSPLCIQADDLAIEDEKVGYTGTKGGNEIGELRVLRLMLATQSIQAVAIEPAEHRQAVELGLENPVKIIKRLRHLGALHHAGHLGMVANVSVLANSASIGGSTCRSMRRCLWCPPCLCATIVCLGHADQRREKRYNRSESSTLRRIEVVSGKKKEKFRR